MRSNLIKRFFICFLIGFFIFSFNSIVFAGGSINVQLGKGSDSDQSKFVKNNKKSSEIFLSGAFLF